MAITWSGQEYERNLAHEWIVDPENIKDIKENLKSLKSDILDKIKKWDPDHKYLGENITDNDELLNKALDQEFTSIDVEAEALFDKFAHDHESELDQIIRTSDNVQAQQLLKNLQLKFEDYLFNSSELKGKFNEMKTISGDIVKFELNDLRSKISVPTWYNWTTNNNENRNVFLDDINGWNNVNGWNQEKYKDKQYYVDPYKDRDYTEVTKDKNIANIYKDNKVAKYMEKIFDDEERGELRRGAFRINLGVEDWLAGIIIAIREAIQVGTSSNANTESDAYKLYTKLTDTGILQWEWDTLDIQISPKQLREIEKLWLLEYKRAGWLDPEIIKVTDVLSRTKRKDLDVFASILQSKTDIAMGVKELNNANEMTGNDKEHPGEASLISADNVLNFLCDFNSDGQISAAYRRKNNRKQENQWDVGTLFGQQVMFTIEQAIDTQDVKLGKPLGEQLVIGNIIKNMQISDSRNLTETQRSLIITMQKDDKECTKENLALLVNGNGDGNAMPEMKIFFLDAIKKINGWSKAVQPDLYDTLVGKDTESLISLYEKESDLRIALDEILLASEDPWIKLFIREQGLVRVRETIFTGIMTALDNVRITTNDGSRTQLQAAGVQKWRELNGLKKQILEQTLENLILSWIHYSKTGGLRFSIGHGKEWVSPSGRTKRNRWAMGGLTISPSNVELSINLSAGIAEQYNYNRVINADLSQVRSAKYFGIEWWVYVGFGTKWARIPEASGGINRQQDPVIGINQIDKQYRAISEEIFDVSDIGISANKNEFKKQMQAKIDAGRPPYTEFMATNRQHLTDNLDFIVRYMDANKFFWPDGILKKYPKVNTSAINALLDVLQSGNIEQRRSNVIEWLHGHLALTKLSFGITTAMLTHHTVTTTITGTKPKAEGNAGETRDGTVIVSWNGTTKDGSVIVSWNGGNEWSDTYTRTDPNAWSGNNEWSGSNDNQESKNTTNEDKFGIAGAYVWARISTWRNIYVPNVEQHLFAEYEMGQGINTEYIDNPIKDLNKYGEYLVALYHDPKNRLWYTIDAGRLILTFDPQWSNLTLAKFLNLHMAVEKINTINNGANENNENRFITDKNEINKEVSTNIIETPEQTWFSLRGNTLTIGNVGDIGAYTVTEAKWVNRVLCLGSKNLDDAIRVTGNTWPEIVDPMRPKETYNKERSQEKINTDIINTMTGDWENINMAKTETAAFFDAEGKLQKPEGYTVTFEPVDILGKTLTIWTLTIQKNTDGTFVVGLDETNPTDQLTIIYKDLKEYEIAYTEAANNSENREEVETYEITDLFPFESDMLQAKTELIRLSSSLEELENADPKAYADFLLDASTPGADGEINDDELSQAIVHLEILMTKDKQSPSFTILKWFLDGDKEEVKSYIVDRMKQILAREPLYKISTIGQILTSHKWREKVKWPSKQTIPANLLKEMKVQRDEVKKTYMSTKFETNPTIDENLIGYTAFYRPQAQKYSITSLGETGYQWEIKNISETNKETAQSWFLENFKMNKHEVEYFAKNLEAQFAAQWLAVTLKNENYADTLSSLESLIQWDVLLLDSWEKISIDIDWVFYLLGDCCNESLGMKIKNITIQRFKKTVVVEWSYSASWTPDKRYTGGMDIYSKSHSITSRVIPEEEKVGLTYNKKTKERRKYKTIDNRVDANWGETKNEWDMDAWGGSNEW